MLTTLLMNGWIVVVVLWMLYLSNEIRKRDELIKIQRKEIERLKGLHKCATKNSRITIPNITKIRIN